MKKIDLVNINSIEYKKLLKRPGINFEKSYQTVKPIIDEIKLEGEEAVLRYAKKYDGKTDNDLLIASDEIQDSEKYISGKLKNAIEVAIKNITKFHEQQIPSGYEIETMNGVNCGRIYKPIESVGLYIPGGSAPLFSTLLMLAIPAKLAGCKRIVVCTPPFENTLSKEVLYCAKLLEINEIYSIGGAQAIGFMAYGTDKNKKVEKIFGPGNQYVTAAKSLVSIDSDGCAIDMPAGPSEVLIIADESANPIYVAADLLSQAEHGIDSQVVLLSTNNELLNDVEIEVSKQLAQLPRNKIASQSLKNSLLIKCNSIEQMFEFSNEYAPEHLIINLQYPREYLKNVNNAGSVFLGSHSTESVGDYASGTNHSLPTYGYAKSFSGVNVLSFLKSITYQELTKEGLQLIGPSAIEMAEAEKLDAHANAVRVRLDG